ncbi:unnamed protein product, partial [Didymodactylos carnosus]
MFETVKQYIRSCQQCVRFNIQRRKQPGLSQKEEQGVFDVMQMDFWKSPVRSSDGNQYVLIITDRSSKFIFAEALSSETVKDAAATLVEDIILKHGAINYLQSDQGTHFKNLSIHTTTGYIPYELAFNRKLRSPFDPPSSTIIMSKPNDYWKKASKFKTVAITAARFNIQQQQELSKQRYDIRRANIQYKIGDLVWIRILTGRSKLDQRFH